MFTLLTDIILWPGRQVLRLFPKLSGDEATLIHNITNYVVWLTLICGVLIWVLIESMSLPS